LKESFIILPLGVRFAGAERDSGVEISVLSREALKGPFSKLNGIGHAIFSKPHELAPQRGLQFIVPFEIAKGIASL
jgi:hypothetical protein